VGTEGPPVLRVDPRRPDPEQLQTGAEIIRSGRVIVFPTQCLYGLAADAQNEEAVARIFRIKQRAADKPLLLLIPDRACLEDLINQALPPAAERLMKAFWPGNLTLLLKAGSGVLPALTAGSGKIGVRLPGHPVALQLVRAVGRPITGTSANISGRPGCRDLKEIPQDLLRRTDLVMDAGPLKGGAGSTVVDLTVTPPAILRAGIVPPEAIQRAIAPPPRNPPR